MLKRKYLTNTTFYVGVNVTKHFFIPTFYKCLNVCLYVPKKSGNLLSNIKKEMCNKYNYSNIKDNFD